MKMRNKNIYFKVVLLAIFSFSALLIEAQVVIRIEDFDDGTTLNTDGFSETGDWIKTNPFNSSPSAAIGNSNYEVETAQLTLSNINTLGKTSIKVTWFQYSTDVSTPPITFEYSSDGSNWTMAGFNTPSDGEWVTSGEVTLNAEAENQSNLRLRWTFSGDDTGSSNGIDDLTITGINSSIIDWYNTPNLPINELTSWTSQIDGTGNTNPTNFLADGTTFHVWNGNVATINGNWLVTSSLGLNLSRIELGNGLNDIELIVPSSSTISGIIDVSNRGKLTLRNSLFPTLRSLASNSTINFDASGFQSLPTSLMNNQFGNLQINGGTGFGVKSMINGGTGTSILGILDIFSGTLSIRSSGNPFVLFGSVAGLGSITTSGANVRISFLGNNPPGTIRFIEGVTLNNFIYNRPMQTLNISNNLSLGGTGSAFILTSGIISIGGNNLTINANTSGSGQIISDINARVTYLGVATTVFGGNYGVLSLTGTGTKTLAGDISVFQNLSITSPITLSAASRNITLSGDLNISSGASISGSGHTINFNGTSNQSIISNGQIFRNLVFSNSGTKTLLDATNVTQNLSITGGVVDAGNNTLDGGANLFMNNGSLRLGKSGVTLPEITGTNYNNIGGTIDLYGTGVKALRGSRDYSTLIFSGGTTTLTSAITSVAGVSITGTATLNVEENTFGTSATTLTMTGTSTFITAGSGTRPNMDGAYFLGSGTTLEFSGTSNLDIRTPSSNQNGGAYENVVISGAAGSKSLQSASTVLKINGNFTNNTSGTASFNSNGGTVSLTGVNNQVLTGNSTFSVLGINKPIGGNVSINSGSTISINKLLQINAFNGSNQLTTNNGLTLLSDATQTASLLDYRITGNSINGNVKVQRYSLGISATVGHYFSSPVAAAPFSAILQTGFNTLLYSEDGNPARINFNFSGGFRRVTESALTFMTPGRGFSTVQPITKTIVFDGVPNNGNVSYDLTYNTTVPGSVAGWNLIGNPYPSAIDWGTVDKSGDISSAYLYSVTGYVTLLNSINNFIPSGQGFFVKASSPATLTFKNANRFADGASATANNSFYRVAAARKYLHIDLESKVPGLASKDAAIFSFDSDATDGFDKLDGEKLFNPSPLANIYTLANGNYLAVNILNDSVIKKTIPLYVAVRTGGTYQLSARDVENFYPNIKVFLNDNQNSNSPIDLSINPVYSFDYSTFDANRFSISFANKGESIDTTVATTPGINTSLGENFLALSRTFVVDQELIISDTTGTTKISDEVENGSFQIYSFGSKIYLKAFSNTETVKSAVLFDAMGNKVIDFGTLMLNEDSAVLETNRSGIHILKILSDHSITTKKLFLH